MTTALHDAQHQLRNHLVGREDEADLIMLGLVSGQHVALVGPPGCGKSALIRAVSTLVSESQFVETQVSKFSNPEELFGPLSIPELDHGRYVRLTEGYLPNADFAFVDEAFNASSAVLNTLLGLMNERKFKNGNETIDCPLRVMVAASNLWPVGDGFENTSALFDRFLIRSEIGYADDVSAVLFNELGPLTPCCKLEDIDTAQSEASRLPVSRKAKDAVVEIIAKLSTENCRPSDRRARASIGVAKAAAWLRGATEVEPIDLVPLMHTLWVTPSHRDTTEEIVLTVSNPGQRALLEAIREFDSITLPDKPDYEQLSDILPKMTEIASKASPFKDTPQGRDLIDRVKKTVHDLQVRASGFDADAFS